MELSEIKKLVCTKFNVKNQYELTKRCRKRHIADARHMYLALAKHFHPRMSDAFIAFMIGRDRSMIFHAIKKINNIPKLKAMFNELIKIHENIHPVDK
jgi:chromosomal replication initiation ATPase DnaA